MPTMRSFTSSWEGGGPGGTTTTGFVPSFPAGEGDGDDANATLADGEVEGAEDVAVTEGAETGLEFGLEPLHAPTTRARFPVTTRAIIRLRGMSSSFRSRTFLSRLVS